MHRIGRTGRAGRSGMAISVIEPREHRRLRLLESHTKAKIEVRTVPTLTDARAKRLSILKNSLAEMCIRDRPYSPAIRNSLGRLF